VGLFIVIWVILGVGCEQKQGCKDPEALNYDPEAQVDDGSCVYQAGPIVYAFVRDELSSVSYEKQALQNLLIQDIRTKITQLAEAGAQAIVLQDFLDLYEMLPTYQGMTLADVAPFEPLSSTYTDIETDANLQASLANSHASTADTDLRTWFEIIANNSQNVTKLGTSAVYTTSNNPPYGDGLDLKEMITQTLLGAVVYHRGVSYLESIADYDNSSLIEGQNYTEMEHYWDEAFGYWGGAQAYFTFSDEALANLDGALSYNDHNGDAKIDFATEYNYVFAREAGTRDLIDNVGSNPAGTDFSRVLFTAFIEGRKAIIRTDITKRQETEETILNVWEELIAATCIHYINLLEVDMSYIGTSQEDIPVLNRNWSAMKSWIAMLKYNSNIHLTKLIEVCEDMGEAPVYYTPGSLEADAYLLRLDIIKSVFQTTYGFSDTQMQEW